MRVLCRHGHIALYESFAGEIAAFMEYFDVELVRDGEFFTFPLLAQAPKYSIKGLPYLGLLAVKTFAGEPWEILKENGFVYNIALGLLVPKETITFPFKPVQVGYYYTNDGPLIQPGARVEGKQILSYDAAYDSQLIEARLSEYSDE